MPRPPILPLIDWKSIFAGGKDFEAWTASGAVHENIERMKSALRSLELEASVIDALGKVGRTVHVIAIAEDWCGDVVRHVPVLMKISEVQPKIRVRFIARVDHPDVFARYLTNGGEAIPKFIFLNHVFVECGNWGALPDSCRELIARGKACGDVAGARAIISERYRADPQKREVVHELLRNIDIACSHSPQSCLVRSE
jgi:hypothetical protein